MRMDGVNIKRPERYEDIFQAYANPQSEKLYESSPFSSMKDLCMISALFGYEKGLFKPFDKGEFIRINIFSDTDINVIKMIAVSHEKDIKVLENTKRVVEIFEGYINGGFEELMEKLSNFDNISSDFMNLVIERFGLI